MNGPLRKINFLRLSLRTHCGRVKGDCSFCLKNNFRFSAAVELIKKRISLYTYVYISELPSNISIMMHVVYHHSDFTYLRLSTTFSKSAIYALKKANKGFLKIYQKEKKKKIFKNVPNIFIDA